MQTRQESNRAQMGWTVHQTDDLAQMGSTISETHSPTPLFASRRILARGEKYKGGGGGIGEKRGKLAQRAKTGCLIIAWQLGAAKICRIG